MTTSSTPSDDTESVHTFNSSRGPVLDRLSTIVAASGFFLLATNDAPALADFGTTDVVLGCVAVGTLAGLTLYRLFGTGVRGPLWLGVVTAAVLSFPVLLILLLTGMYTATLGWAVSLGCAVFGLGATVRSMQARFGSS